MAFKPFVRIRIGPDEPPTAKHVNTVQDNIAAAIGQLTGKDVLDQFVIKKVVLVPSGINYVNHGLGRTVAGWQVVRTHGTGTAAQVWDVQDANTAQNAKTQLYLMASATGMFDLKVH